jgi:hypothetical protein
MRFSFKKLYFERLLFSGIKVSSGFIFVLVLTFNLKCTKAQKYKKQTFNLNALLLFRSAFARL